VASVRDTVAISSTTLPMPSLRPTMSSTRISSSTFSLRRWFSLTSSCCWTARRTSRFRSSGSNGFVT